MLTVCFMILAGRLWLLQFAELEKYSKLADDNTIREIPMQAERGQIISGDGEILARNAIYFKLSLLSIEIEHSADVIDKISEIIQLTDKDRKRIKDKISENPLDPVPVKDMLDYGTFCRLAEIKSDYPGIMLEAQPVREYPFGESSCHMIGYDGPVTEEEIKLSGKEYSTGDFTGKDGLEKSYDKQLRGKKGAARVRVNAAGHLMDLAGTSYPVPGASIYTTIDTRIQKAAESAIKDAAEEIERINGEKTGAAAVVLNAQTGAVLAMASYPAYDPNKFARGISQKDYDSIIENPANPLLNRPIHGAYPCASTFKIITSAAAMQEGIITENDYFYCGGAYDLQGHIFNCFNKAGHGGISFYEAIAHSCDVVFYRIAVKFPIKKFLKYISAFGIGSRTGIDLPSENRGNLPSEEWKMKTYGEEWYPGDTVNLSIGQGFVEVTPLQTARFTMAAANGGYLYKPYIVKKIYSSEGLEIRKPVCERKLPIDGRHLSAVREGMRQAVEYGTAKRAASRYVSIAGKTGTAENFPTPENPRGLNHTWFTSFAPYEAPETVVTIILEKSGGYGGEYSAVAARKIYDSIYGRE